ncbi:MAG: hypothetical protein CMI18_07700 [Opitutaceae bacterium]|nr:hypothetical protein [Opitutaceae bacterium]
MAEIRSWLTLGRISNLSTVWANGLCAWILGGGGEASVLLILLGALSLIYVGGMYLNDYCDVRFDKELRPERPIPTGKVSRNSVLIVTLVFFAAGIGSAISINSFSALFAGILVGIVVLYNLVHKYTVLGVPLMAACRTGVYVTVGSATLLGLTPQIWGAGVLMFFYILGVTALARTESTELKASAVGYTFLVVPMIGIFYIAGPPFEKLFPISYCLAALWISIAFSMARKGGTFVIEKTIGPLLAGICLIDLAILNSMHLVTVSTLGIFLVLFALAWIAQRYVPAT